MNTKNMAVIPEYTSPLLEEIYGAIPQETFDFVANRMALALRIDQAIKTKGWTQKQFAAAMNKKPSEISRWLSGTHNFTTDTLWHIEQILNINLLAKEENIGINTIERDSLKQFISQEINLALEKYLNGKMLVTR